MWFTHLYKWCCGEKNINTVEIGRLLKIYENFLHSFLGEWILTATYLLNKISIVVLG